MGEKRNSKPIRVSTETLKRLEIFKEDGLTWDGTLKKILGTGSEVWGIDEDLYHTKAQARGAALKRAVKSGRGPKSIGTPVKLLKVIS